MKIKFSPMGTSFTSSTLAAAKNPLEPAELSESKLDSMSFAINLEDQSFYTSDSKGEVRSAHEQEVVRLALQARETLTRLLFEVPKIDNSRSDQDSRLGSVSYHSDGVSDAMVKATAVVKQARPQGFVNNSLVTTAVQSYPEVSGSLITDSENLDFLVADKPDFSLGRHRNFSVSAGDNTLTFRETYGGKRLVGKFSKKKPQSNSPWWNSLWG
jgi:hypothetical protein